MERNISPRQALSEAKHYNRTMISGVSPLSSRRSYLLGLSIALTGAVLFSTKAIVAKLIYRHHVDAVTVLAFRMLFSLPFFVAVAWWKAKTGKTLSMRESMRIVLLGLLGYYLSSFLDFLGLQYISV